jgi:predicted nucleotidyltransferase
MKLDNKEKAVLRILKDVSKEYNANNLSKKLGLSSMGTLKILRNLEKEEVVNSRKVSNIKFYEFDFKNSYARDYASLIFRKEAESSQSFLRRWIKEIRKIKNAKIGILFGSILRKGKSANDVDVLFVVDQKDFDKLKKEVSELNKLADKKIHPVYQTKKDFIKNLVSEDEVVLEIIKGILVFGEKEFVEILGEIK